MALDPHRLMPIEPEARAVARRLFETVEALPIISPHGHTEPSWYAENERFPDPATLFAALDTNMWQRCAAGEGAKGPRLYDWARLPLGTARENGFDRWMLARRSRHDPQAVAYYFAFAPAETPLAELAAAAGLRWTIEECFLRAKDDLGLDHCEARSWHGWHRHMSLVMAGAAFLARLTAEQRRDGWGKPNKTSPALHLGAA